MFPSTVAGLARFAGVAKEDRREYAALVLAGLRSGKLRLRSGITGGGSIFVIPKSSGRLREIWNGRRVSAAAAQPPPPRWLACPSRYRWMRLPPETGRSFRCWKRDGRCLFDQLLLPSNLRGFFGRPSVGMQDLVEAGMRADELIGFQDDPGDLAATTRWWPVSRVWSMVLLGHLAWRRR